MTHLKTDLMLDSEPKKEKTIITPEPTSRIIMIYLKITILTRLEV
jgi:hypothetical protein